MKIKLLTLLSLCFFITYSCKKNTEEEFVDTFSNKTSHKVTLEQAREIARLKALIPGPLKKSKSMLESHEKMSIQRKSAIKNIKSTLSVNVTQADPSFYIINYEGGGFAIVAGDNRLLPIIAYSEESSFPIDSNNTYPSGVAGWLSNMDIMVKEIRAENIKQSKQAAAGWKEMELKAKLANGTLSLDDFPPCVVEGEHYTDYATGGPLLQTQWSQGVGYNDNLPYMNCSNYSNGKPPTGCVATATAQVMKFYQYPNTFSWSLMPDTYASSYTAQLMADIGQHVDMDYDCDGSGTETSKAATALKNVYGYSSATWGDYVPGTVYATLSEGKPAILSGGRKDKWWFFNVYADGHAWVADGYQLFVEYECQFPDEEETDPYADSGHKWVSLTNSLYFHLNWGWGGIYNGWYLCTNFNPGSDTFNYKTGMITNIVP